MKTKTLLMSLLLLTISISGCKFGGFDRGLAGSGNRKSEKRELKPFKSIDTSGAYTISVTCQKPASVEIEADDNILPLIKTEVRDGVLFVTNTQEYHSSKSPVLSIGMTDLDKLADHGAGEVTIAGVNNNQLSLASDGAGSIVASGNTKFIKIGSNGAGSVDAGNLHAEKAQVTVSGAASIDVYATEQLDVDISGVGNVTYGGNPKTVNKNISGVGNISPKGK